jgi:hypothetical protein
MTGRSRTRVATVLTVAVIAGVMLAATPASPQTGSGPITAFHSGRVMDVFGASTAPGAPIVQWTANGGNNQAWQVKQFGLFAGNPLVLIQSVNSPHVLDATSATANGTQLVQNPWTGAPSQWWIAYPFGTTGYTVLFNVNSVRVADVAGASQANGAHVIQWDWKGALNQLWTIPAIIPPATTTTTTSGATTTTTSGATTTTSAPATTTTSAPATTTTAPATTTTTSGGGQTTPTLTGLATLLAPFGSPISDVANLSGGSNPTGTLTFNVYTDGECATPPVYTNTVPVAGNGQYSSGNFVPTEDAAYIWRVSYSGDANNAAVSTVCGDPNQVSLLLVDPEP